VPMSELIPSFLKLAVVPARFGLIVTEAAVSLGKSVVDPEPASNTGSSAPSDRLSDQEIDAAAGVIRASLLTGQPVDFHEKLRTKFPDVTIRAMAEAVLLAARNARISSESGYRRAAGDPRLPGTSLGASW
jgi:hypothetical protein